LRSSDRTMTIRVNEVARARIEGTRDSTVISTRSCTPELTCPGPPAGSTLRVTRRLRISEQPVNANIRTGEMRARFRVIAQFLACSCSFQGLQKDIPQRHKRHEENEVLLQCTILGVGILCCV
jgi:hypothetical protein